jgi:LDH2 family malate/lactate/ureidoglycolate dehydrogenase
MPSEALNAAADRAALAASAATLRALASETRLTGATLHLALVAFFCATGMSAADAKDGSDAAVFAQLSGSDSHGAVTLPLYAAGLLDGTIKARPKMRFLPGLPASCVLDADNALGLLAARHAIEHAVSLAKTYGLGAVAVRNSSHFGTAGYLADFAAARGCIGIAVSNAGPAIAPPGGSQAYLGTNPIGAGVPLSGEPFVLDMATTIVARSKIRQSLAAGVTTLPEGWALDRDGNPTTDTNAALDGSILPIGGPKGFGLALLIELLSSALSDGEPGAKITYEHVVRRPSQTGHFVLAIDPAGFAGSKAFIDRASRIVADIERSRTGPSASRPRLPGRRAQATRRTAAVEGFVVIPNLAAALRQTADMIDKRLA